MTLEPGGTRSLLEVAVCLAGYPRPLAPRRGAVMSELHCHGCDRAIVPRRRATILADGRGYCPRCAEGLPKWARRAERPTGHPAAPPVVSGGATTNPQRGKDTT